MAQVSDFLDNSLPQIDAGVASIQKEFSVGSGDGDSGDVIEVFQFPPEYRGRLTDAVLRVSATLGASVTLQARINDGSTTTNITGATTAAQADKVDSSAIQDIPLDLNGGEMLELVIAGANIGATATVTVDFQVASR